MEELAVGFLVDVVGRAELHRAHRDFLGARAGGDDDGDRCPPRHERGQHLQPVRIGKLVVHDHQVVEGLVEGGKPFLARCANLHPVAVRLQLGADQPRKPRIVLDVEDPDVRAHAGDPSPSRTRLRRSSGCHGLASILQKPDPRAALAVKLPRVAAAEDRREIGGDLAHPLQRGAAAHARHHVVQENETDPALPHARRFPRLAGRRSRQGPCSPPGTSTFAASARMPSSSSARRMVTASAGMGAGVVRVAGSGCPDGRVFSGSPTGRESAAEYRALRGRTLQLDLRPQPSGSRIGNGHAQAEALAAGRGRQIGLEQPRAGLLGKGVARVAHLEDDLFAGGIVCGRNAA